MTDLLIESDGSQWDLALADGDLVLTSSLIQEVGQRVVFRLMTWYGESAYDTTAGVPYLDGIFGVEPVEGVAALLELEVQDTDGVDEIISQDYQLDATTRELTIALTIRAGLEVFDLALELSPS